MTFLDGCKMTSNPSKLRIYQRFICTKKAKVVIMAIAMVTPLAFMILGHSFPIQQVVKTPVKVHPLHVPEAKYVNIMEEHHEVLMYWYSAAATGAIRENGNVLLHIDGHSDAAIADNWRKMPLFRMPRTPRDVKSMMMGNDLFIVAAGGTGLINRFIWVWPPYDVGGYGHPHNEAYVSGSLKVGVYFKRHEERYILQMCFCGDIPELNIENWCARIDDNANEDEDDLYFTIDESKCLDKIQALSFELVSTQRAIELAQTGTWLTESDSVILDIDEDFYACEAASQPLYDLGMTKASVKSISLYVSKLLCVDNARDEQRADQFFHDLIETVIAVNRRCRSRAHPCSSVLRRTNTVLEFSIPLLAKSWKVTCLPNQSSLFLLKRLVKRLVPLSRSQLVALQNVGVCMNSSPRGSDYNINEGMTLCIGYNGPNSTLVQYHSVDEREMGQTTLKLRRILTQPFQPGVVTLVRSVRDGYTPRQNFHSIESKVLKVLKLVYPTRVNKNTVHYDSQLLGGPQGWYRRHYR